MHKSNKEGLELGKNNTRLWAVCSSSSQGFGGVIDIAAQFEPLVSYHKYTNNPV